MAGRGPAPKATPLARPNDERRKMQRFEQIRADGQLRGPDLPEDVSWHPMTVKWWQTWRLSAQALTFTPTDWDFLLDTALLHTSFWDGTASAGSELRIRVAKFGATVEDRLRLRIEAAGDHPDDTAAGQPPTAVKSSSSSTARRRRLLKAVKGDD